MNVEMWNHVATQANLEILRKRDVHFVDPGEGYQACGEVGMGRLAEPDEIVRRAIDLCSKKGTRARDFLGEHVLVTAGPTIEDLDPVRFISNRSSGRMGYAMAEAALIRGARVTLISGPVKLSPPQGIETVNVRTTREMYEAVTNRLPDATVFIGCAAVSDFRPATPAGQKIKKEGRNRLTIELEATEDIIEAVGKYQKGQKRIVAGFAAESESLLENAEAKLRQKGLDLIVANDITLNDRGFDVETNKATIIKRDGSRIETPLLDKRELAHLILSEIAGLFYGRQ
jgi:phosphopantothenoylcysteine decarboxylase/phosphopantothenate--cysteine ligase